MSTTSAQYWPGLFRFAPPTCIAIFVFSIIAFVLAASYAPDAAETPMFPQSLIYMVPRPSNALWNADQGQMYLHRKIIFYAATMPFLSIIHSIVDLGLSQAKRLSPTYVVTASSIFFIGWLTQWTIWMDCEVTGIGFDNSGAACFQRDLDHIGYFLTQSSAAAVNARVGVGFLVLFLYGSYVVCAALALHENRRSRKSSSVPGKAAALG